MMTTSLAKRVFSLLFSLVLLASLVPATAFAATTSVDTTWYTENPDAETYTLSNASQLAGLAEIVNKGTDDFTDKTITLSQTINGFDTDFIPIGTDEFFFNGTFDGGGYTIDNFNIVTEDTYWAYDAGATNISFVGYAGIFGHVGKDSLVENVTLGNALTLDISLDDSDERFIRYVGLLVGYSEGSLSNISCSGDLSLSSNAPQKSAESTFPIEAVGGIAGVCYGSLVDCSFSGSLNIVQTSAPVSEYDQPEIVHCVGGVVGFEGDFTQLGKTTNPDTHGSIINCTNTGEGTFCIDTPNEAGTDRFGETVLAQSARVGGVAGYSRGSVSDCTNYVYINAPHAHFVGGIVGSLRYFETYSSDNYPGQEYDEGSEDDPIVCERCVNVGIVYGHVAVGGIAGEGGTFTTIIGCMNGERSYKENRLEATFVLGTRWNKPCIGGIAGRTYGSICYCGNLGIVASASWGDFDTRTLKQASGYYAAGITGTTFCYGTTDEETGLYGTIPPTPQVYNCYNAGSIESLEGYRSRNIIGDNEGDAYDNAALDGMCPDNMNVYGEIITLESDAKGEAWNNLVCAEIEGYDQTAEGSLKGDGIMTYKYRVDQDGQEVWLTGTKDSIFQHLNSYAGSAGNEWSTYWTASPETADGQAQLNSGYPVLNWQVADLETTDLSEAELSLVENAAYTGGDAIPTVSATLNGQTLLQNVDFRVVPEVGATEVTEQGVYPYMAYIEGIGKYSGTSLSKVAYGINQGDLATCTVTVSSGKFNWTRQEPSADDVVVRSPSGTVVDPSEYDFALAPGQEPVNAGAYDVIVSAKENSNFTGTLDGSWRILTVSLKDIAFDDVARITYMGQTYNWYSTTSLSQIDWDKVPVFQYTGHPIEPSVENVTYLGQTMSEGDDYTVVYASLGSDPNDDDDSGSGITIADKNIGTPGEITYGAIMVRYIPGTNFSNYVNMIFKIDGTSTEKISLSDAVVNAPNVIYEDEPMCPVSVTYAGQTLTEGTDYEISYANNNAPGVASFMIKGIGLFEGELSGTFEITSGSPFEFYGDVVTIGNTRGVCITGFSYMGLKDSFDLEIPSTISIAGVEYPVTAIGDNAFGGTHSSDFDGTDKLKIASVYIPASVIEIGSYAFGSDAFVTPSITSVVFEEGSQLTTIGEGAFAYCRGLSEFNFPAKVENIADKAFYMCTSLVTLIFDTKDPTLPSNVGSNSFNGVGNGTVEVEVLGYGTAEAVIALALNNATIVLGETGVNGGKNFHFVERKGDLSDATITAIPDQIYTGSAIEPAVEVVLDGAVVDSSDYTLSFTDNVSLGSVAMVTATGANGYTGSCSATFNIVAEVGYFTDVQNPEEYYYDAVYDLAALGVITGYNPTTFGTGDSMSRAQLVTIMWRYCEPDEYAKYNEPAAKNTTGLPDVPDGMYYTGAVNWAVANGVVTGNLHDDGTYTFNPDDPVTFDQLATIVARYVLGGTDIAAAYPTTALDNGAFTDKGAVEEWARGPMSWAIEVGLVTGNNNHDGTYTLDALSPVARERAATVLWRSIDGGLLAPLT